MPWYTPLAVLVGGCPLRKRLGSFFWRRPQRREELWKRGRDRRVQPRQPSSQPWCTRSFSSNAELNAVHCPLLYIRCTSYRTQPLVPLVPDCATKEHCDPGLFSMDWHAADQLLEILFSPGQSDHPGRGLHRFESRRQLQSRRCLSTKKHKETVIDRDIIIYYNYYMNLISYFICVPTTGRSQIRLSMDTSSCEPDSSLMCSDQHDQHLTNRPLIYWVPSIT